MTIKRSRSRAGRLTITLIFDRMNLRRAKTYLDRILKGEPAAVVELSDGCHTLRYVPSPRP